MREEVIGVREREPKLPGQRGYAAYWRWVVSHSRLAKIKGQPENVSGRALLALLKTYGEHLDNISGECWPSQPMLAMEAGLSKRTVERAQDLAQRLGFLRILRPPVPGDRGYHMAALVPDNWRTIAEGVVVTTDDDPRSEVVVSNPEVIVSKPPRSSSVEPEVVVSSDEETLTLNSQYKNSQDRNSQDILDLSTLRDGDEVRRSLVDALDDEARRLFVPSFDSDDVMTYEPRLFAEDQQDRPVPTEDEFYHPRTVVSRLPEWKQRQVYERQLRDEGLDPNGEPIQGKRHSPRWREPEG